MTTATLTTTSVEISALPTEMEQALLEFGLMSAFRARSTRRQQDYVRYVIAAESDDERVDRISCVLDDVAINFSIEPSFESERY